MIETKTYELNKDAGKIEAAIDMPAPDMPRIYRAFSGADMTIHINEKPCAALQAITVSITREVIPVYENRIVTWLKKLFNIFSPNSYEIKKFTLGRRGIAGTLTLSVFDRDELLRHLFAGYNYADELPEFNITITMVDEDGAAAYQTLSGVKLVSQDFSMTMDDMTRDTTYIYYAKSISPLTPLFVEDAANVS